MFKKISRRKRKMQIIKNKKVATAIVIFLIAAITATTVLIPSTNAHSPPWTIVSYAYLSAAPNPVGVGQAMDIVMWVDAPLVGATVDNDIRRHDYTLTITKPDGTIETKN